MGADIFLTNCNMQRKLSLRNEHQIRGTSNGGFPLLWETFTNGGQRKGK